MVAYTCRYSSRPLIPIIQPLLQTENIGIKLSSRISAGVGYHPCFFNFLLMRSLFTDPENLWPSGVVLEISLSILQTAGCHELLQCLYNGIFVQNFQWRCNTIFFCKGLQFSFMATKKRSSLDFLSFDSKQKHAVYALWNLVAEKGWIHCRGTNPEWSLETSETPLNHPWWP